LEQIEPMGFPRSVQWRESHADVLRPTDTGLEYGLQFCREQGSRQKKEKQRRNMTPQGFRPVSKKADFIDLPGMSIGMLLQIQFEGLGSSQSRLIGLDYGNYVIIQTPSLACIRSKLFEKNHGIIRYLFSGHVYAFHCTLLSVVTEPYRFSILSYPESLENMNLRKHERVSCIIAAEVNLKGRMNKGIVSNISMGGCSFEFDRSSQREFPDLKVQENVIIALYLNDQGAAAVYNAVIRKVQIDQESMTAGLQFTASESDESKAKSERDLREYLLTLQNS
jgi:hypothetical protein